jgi:hypothetical protein
MPNRTGLRHEVKAAKRKEAEQRQSDEYARMAARYRRQIEGLGLRDEYTDYEWESDAFITITWEQFLNDV